MSGFEVGGIALGTLPIILEAIKGYREAYHYIQAFQHAKKQLNIIGASFRVCRLNFLNECQLLLELILFDSRLSKEMISDPQHPLWQETATKEQMTELLKDNLDACTTIVGETQSTISSFMIRLQAVSGGSGKNSLQRARASATFMVEKGRFERDIEVLRRTNANLSLLREQITSLGPRSRTARVGALSGASSTVVKRFSQIQVASRHLHDTLKNSWSCFDRTHLCHWVKLGADSGIEPENLPGSVNLDMAISCEIAPQMPKQNATIWLFVRSESRASASQLTPNPLENLVQSLQSSVSSSHISSQMSPTQSTSQQSPTTSVAASSTSAVAHDVDICTVACVCSHFQKNINAFSRSQQSNCWGFLKSPNDARYLFYPPPKPRVLTTSATPVEEVTTLITLIEQSQRRSLELLLQLQLALKMAISVLQFHNTAWLSPVWGLDHISIFGSELSDDTLKSLHLSIRFDSSTATGSSAQLQGNATSHQPNAPVSSTGQSNNSRCPSIYNETLFSLGIALLEIAHWQSFQTLTQNDPDEVRAAHRLVRGPAPLGPKFRKIVERCIRCDFEAGTENLEDASLQYAVWSKAVYPLESLIKDMSQVV